MGEWELNSEILDSARWFYTLSVIDRDCPILSPDAEIKAVEVYVTNSASDPVIYESVRRYVLERIESGMGMPVQVMPFLKMALSGSKPHGKTGRVSNAVRDRAICETVKMLRDVHKIKPTRYEHGPKAAGVDYVHKVLEERGEAVSHSTLSNIVSRSQQSI